MVEKKRQQKQQPQGKWEYKELGFAQAKKNKNGNGYSAFIKPDSDATSAYVVNFYKGKNGKYYMSVSIATLKSVKTKLVYP